MPELVTAVPHNIYFEKAVEWLRLDDTRRRNILDQYMQDHRSYHNYNHICQMLEFAFDMMDFLATPDYQKEVVLLSILYHDICYAAHPVPMGYNEANSIAYFARSAEYPLYVSTRVIEAINATAYHLNDQKNISQETKIVLDSDLSTFAFDYDRYVAIADNVLQEAARINKVPVWKCLKGNKWFLEQLLKRERIFYLLGSEDEEKARANITARIADIDKLLAKIIVQEDDGC